MPLKPWFIKKNGAVRNIGHIPVFGLSDKTWTCGLYHPNRPEYLFLAVFAFSSPFCYAKTAFSYSPDIISPCTPDLFMVKDVVKFESEMIDMWSYFQEWKEQKKTKKKLRSSSMQMPWCNVRNRFCECFRGYYTTAHRKCQIKLCGHPYRKRW